LRARKQKQRSTPKRGLERIRPGTSSKSAKNVHSTPKQNLFCLPIQYLRIKRLFNASIEWK
jgi:hypothetical protein